MRPRARGDAPSPRPADDLMALLDNPKLLLTAPTVPTSSVDQVETANLTTIPLPSHKDRQQQITKARKALRRMVTTCHPA